MKDKNCIPGIIFPQERLPWSPGRTLELFRRKRHGRRAAAGDDVRILLKRFPGEREWMPASSIVRSGTRRFSASRIGAPMPFQTRPCRKILDGFSLKRTERGRSFQSQPGETGKDNAALLCLPVGPADPASNLFAAGKRNAEGRHASVGFFCKGLPNIHSFAILETNQTGS